jgi:hypothetical protein
MRVIERKRKFAIYLIISMVGFGRRRRCGVKMSLFDWLLIGHLIGDFVLQSDRVAKNKTGRWPWLLGHVALYMVVITAIVVVYALSHPLPPWLAVAALLFVLATHVMLDQRGFTRWWMRLMGMAPDRLWLAIVVDQVFHLVTLAIVAQALVWASG